MLKALRLLLVYNMEQNSIIIQSYSFTSALFCVFGSSFSMPWLSQPWFLPALLEPIDTSSFTSVGAAKKVLDSSNISAICCGGMPASRLFSMKTKPYFDAADKSWFGASGFEGETSMTGMLTLEISIFEYTQ